MSDELKDRIAIVTAAGSGMGQGAAVAFAEAGAHVYVVDIDATAAKTTVGKIEERGGSATAFELDVTDLGGWRELLDLVEAQHSKLHVLYNHAGIPGPAGLDVDADVFDKVIDINMKSAFMSTQMALPLLEAAAPHACILYTSSTSGMAAAPTSPIYGMTKGGIINLMRSVAKAVGPRGIRANAICPGTVITPMSYDFVRRNSPDAPPSVEEIDKSLDTMINTMVPLRRRGTPEDIGHAALFLASDNASYITGVALPVDGGYLA